MILGIGSDIVLISRIENIINKYQNKFLNKVFHPLEQSYALSHKNAAQFLASRFAAKEAGLKALGTGRINNFQWADIYVNHDALGKPNLVVTGSIETYLQDQLRPQGLNACWHLTLTHDGAYAQAFVILEGCSG